MNNKIKGFSTVRTLCVAAMLTALSFVIAYFCKMFLTLTPNLRITFENIPIIMSGYFFGPVVGFFVGFAADFLSTLVSQYGLAGMNPIITLGAASVGLMAGLMSWVLKNKKDSIKLMFSVGLAHIVGNMIVKSAGLMIYFGTPIKTILCFRVPLYIVIGTIEYFILLLIVTRKEIKTVIRGKKN